MASSAAYYREAPGGKAMRLAIWSTTTPRQNSTHEELFRRQLDEIELAERIGIDQIWFYEHHLNPAYPVREHGQYPAVPEPTARG
jgi:alkanesulfonate monooxygenase SsuD/methylene tetrahydromethanopterin reductase-like flavin-dependent oxidoreductase (luciferase family)